MKQVVKKLITDVVLFLLGACTFVGVIFISLLILLSWQSLIALGIFIALFVVFSYFTGYFLTSLFNKG